MSAADPLITNNQAAFAMKAFAQRQGQPLELWPYVRYVLWHLDCVISGTFKRLVVALPPRHGKTFLCSISFAAWILAHNPAAKILIVSYGQQLAEKIAFEIRAILQNKWYRRLFKTRLKKTKLNDLVTTAGGGVRSVSVEGGATGLGADFILIDDAVQIKDCENDRQLDRINSLFDSEIRTRLNNQKRGAIVIVAHRLAENDLPGHVLQEGGWKLVQLPLIAPRARTYRTDNGFVWSRRKGELLRPDAFTVRDVERLRRMKRPGFETLHQQNPGARDRLRIKPENVGVFVSAEVPAELAGRAVDRSWSKRRTIAQLQRHSGLGPPRRTISAARSVPRTTSLQRFSRRSLSLHSPSTAKRDPDRSHWAGASPHVRHQPETGYANRFRFARG